MAPNDNGKSTTVGTQRFLRIMEEDFYAIGGLPASPPETPADMSGRIISDGGPAGAARHGGHNVKPHGGLAWDPSHGGHDGTPPIRTGADTLLGLSQCGIDDAIQELDNELNAVRSRLRTLSMQRSQRVRTDIHKTLSDRSSPLSDTVINAPKRNVTRQPPRTAADCEGGK